ncbi:hypothetical protein T03_4043 [Trichinella britovi]|uniref:Uncharacterized protein n=1 Tax=Trichinella britovi TaxID=45882 RepID=A0A0V1AYM0_TRIBR|nr:hypothetical protein T03_4043 [Trichinella britovi]
MKSATTTLKQIHFASGSLQLQTSSLISTLLFAAYQTRRNEQCNQRRCLRFLTYMLETQVSRKSARPMQEVIFLLAPVLVIPESISASFLCSLPSSPESRIYHNFSRQISDDDV